MDEPMHAGAQSQKAQAPGERSPKGGAVALLKLMRPTQWTKSVFVLLGPLYGLRDVLPEKREHVVVQALIAACAFAIASSACYIFNDLRDAEADRAHPRKRHRPIASGAVSASAAWVLVGVCLAGAAALAAWVIVRGGAPAFAAMLVAYVLNVAAYSLFLKHRPVADVMSLSIGFVLRVLAGCAAAAIVPSSWLLNSALFLAMFLAFGKRLGERRSASTLGFDVVAARKVQGAYSDDLLRMAVVVTGVATLVTYASYVQAQEAKTTHDLLGMSMNWLWLSVLPACYLLLRCVLLLDAGKYDDPTEMLTRDRPLQLAGFAFALVSGGVFAMSFMK
jgi:decaprenyl-phosphate phosphoribosyltransferase